MKRNSFCMWLLAIELLAGCSEPNALLRIRFSDQQAKDTIKQLELWAFKSNEVDCQALQDDLVDPHQPGLSRMAHLLIGYPPGQSTPTLPEIPIGLMTFFVEGRTALDQTILAGCNQVEIKALGSVVVEIEMRWICHPTTEICSNDIDDDCDGQIDEQCDDCEVDQDCDDKNPCTYDFCIADKCHRGSLPDMSPCSDQNKCTIGDRCLAGVCVGEERDCSAFDGPCKFGVCDQNLGECGPVARENGTACDDNAWCTQNDACLDGECKGIERDCDDQDPCTVDTCDEAEQRCKQNKVPIPEAEGPPGNETCSNRVDDDCDGYIDTHDANCIDCTTDRDCDDGNPCTEDQCQGMICSNLELPEGTSCNDNKFCTVADQCIGGVCQGSGRDCSEGLGPCQIGICKENEAKCVAQAKADGEACDDGLWCSVGNQCFSGECVGGPRDCEDGDSCSVDTCDETHNRCVHELEPIPNAEGPPGDDSCTNGLDDDCDGNIDQEDPSCIECTADLDCDDDNPCTRDFCLEATCQNEAVADNTSCDDQIWCTQDDVCTRGVCSGTARSCSHLDDACHDGRCDEASTQCVADQRVNGTACDDGLWCTQPDQCLDGICSGVVRDCDDGNPCTIDTCSEDQNICLHESEEIPNAEGPPGHSNCDNGQDDDCDGYTDLDDQDCYDCLSDQQCNDNNPCTSDACVQGVCIVQALANGTACDDGVWCTIDDACQESTCVGQARDCSHVAQACKNAQCNEQTEACEAVSMPDNTSCSDGAYCTVDDRCLSGECIGVARDCSHLSDLCVEGQCDDQSDSCIAVNKAENSPCQDGLFCTVDDSCQAGQCVGVAIDCDDADTCTIDACDEDNNRCTHALNPQPGQEGGPGDVTCSNGVDDDCDQATDLADTDCYNCSSPGDCADGNPCTEDVCSAGLCYNDPLTDGTACDDSKYCTVNDRCTAGLCSGDSRDCSHLNQPCVDGVCNEALGQCQAQAKADGSACSDSKWCTVGDQCLDGNCVSNLRDCSDDDPCTKNVCDESADVCDNSPTNLPQELDICGDDLDQDCDGILNSCCLTTGSYQLAFSTDTGANPWFIDSADIDEDGILDLVTVNRDGDSFSVFLGNGEHGRGDGTFTPAGEYPVGDSPYHVAIADLNDDDLLDVAVANRGDHSVSIYFGQGANGNPTGAFGDRLDLSFAGSTGPMHILALDVNADGIRDLVTANWESDDVGVFLGQGVDGKANGSFATPVLYSLSSININPRALCAGDFDSDGITDLAVANWNGGKLSLLKGGGSSGRGDGSFSLMGEYDAGSSQVSIQTDDFNSDGILDLAVVSMNTNAVNILLGNGTDGRGDGTFCERTAFSTGSTPVAAAIRDLDADGILDLVVAEWGAGNVSVLLGNGSNGRADGSFGGRDSFSVDTFPSAVVVGDYSGDGLLDIAVCNYGPDTINLLTAQGSGGIGDGSFVPVASVAVGSSPRSLSVGDLNADSLVDLLVVNEEDNALASFLGLGSDGRANGAFGPDSSISGCQAPRFVDTADVDGDRILDALVACEEGSVVQRYLGLGTNAQPTGGFALAEAIPTGENPAMLKLVDLNADQILDLIILDSEALKVHLGLGTNGTPTGGFGAPTAYPAGSNASAFALGDLNADDILDVAIANPNSNWVTIKLGLGSGGRGSGAFGESTTFAMGTKPVYPILVDIDKDGILDLISANSGSDDISIRRGNGSSGRGDGTFGAQSTIAVGQTPVMVQAYDLDLDNDLDLVVANQHSASVSVILGTGLLGVFGQATHIDIGGKPIALKVAHADWDGRIDLLVVDQQGNRVVILRQTGSCTQ